MIPAFTLEEKLNGKNIILMKRNHDFDKEMWQAVDKNRDFLRQYLFWVDATKSLDNVANTTKKFGEDWAAQTRFAYNIIDKHSGKLLGAIDIHDIDLTNRIAAIGYWLRKDKTGFGYMSDAVKTIEKAVFSKNIRRLEITCDSLNRASANVALRNDYKYECTQKEAIYTYGEFRDKEFYVKFNFAHK